MKPSTQCSLLSICGWHSRHLRSFPSTHESRGVWHGIKLRLLMIGSLVAWPLHVCLPVLPSRLREVDLIDPKSPGLVLCRGWHQPCICHRFASGCGYPQRTCSPDGSSLPTCNVGRVGGCLPPVLLHQLYDTGQPPVLLARCRFEIHTCCLLHVPRAIHG
jgi:hypothetical protein